MTPSGTLADELYAGPGLRSFGVSTVVKFGGSLLADLEAAWRVAKILGDQSNGGRLLVFPGGGPTDKLIESMARELGFGGSTINPACMRALDQTGILLAAMHPRLAAVVTLAEAREVLARAHVPVLLPSQLILSLDVFTREDVITSDSLGAYFAFVVGAERYVVLTDVDGVYDSISGPAENRRLLETVTADELIAMGATSVDHCLAPFLRTVRLPTWVLNGFAADRLAELLAGRQPLGTRIEAGRAR